MAGNRDHLVPKQITNANGIVTTVYVNPRDVNYIDSGPLAAIATPKRADHANNRPEDDQIAVQATEYYDQLVAGNEVNLSSSINGITVNYRIGETGPDQYHSVDQPIGVSVITKSGAEVFLMDVGRHYDYTLSDGSIRSSFYVPCDAEGNDLDEALSSEEYEALMEAVERADEIGFVDKVPQSQGVREQGILLVNRMIYLAENRS